MNEAEPAPGAASMATEEDFDLFGDAGTYVPRETSRLAVDARLAWLCHSLAIDLSSFVIFCHTAIGGAESCVWWL